MSVANGHKPRSVAKQGPRSGVHRLSPLTQALDQRDFAFTQAKALNALPPATTTLEARLRAQTLKDLNTVWDTSCDRAMILQGKGKPKSVPARNDPEAKAKAKRKTFAPPTVVKELSS